MDSLKFSLFKLNCIVGKREKKKWLKLIKTQPRTAAYEFTDKCAKIVTEVKYEWSNHTIDEICLFLASKIIHTVKKYLDPPKLRRFCQGSEETLNAFKKELSVSMALLIEDRIGDLKQLSNKSEAIDSSKSEKTVQDVQGMLMKEVVRLRDTKNHYVLDHMDPYLAEFKRNLEEDLGKNTIFDIHLNQVVKLDLDKLLKDVLSDFGLFGYKIPYQDKQFISINLVSTIQSLHDKLKYQLANIEHLMRNGILVQNVYLTKHESDKLLGKLLKPDLKHLGHDTLNKVLADIEKSRGVVFRAKNLWKNVMDLLKRDSNFLNKLKEVKGVRKDCLKLRKIIINLLTTDGYRLKSNDFNLFLKELPKELSLFQLLDLRDEIECKIEVAKEREKYLKRRKNILGKLTKTHVPTYAEIVTGKAYRREMKEEKSIDLELLLANRKLAPLTKFQKKIFNSLPSDIGTQAGLCVVYALTNDRKQYNLALQEKPKYYSTGIVTDSLIECYIIILAKSMPTFNKEIFLSKFMDTLNLDPNDELNKENFKKIYDKVVHRLQNQLVDNPDYFI